MTYWQRLLTEYPDMQGLRPESKEVRCPSNFGYEVKQRGMCQKMTCTECWNRRIQKAG